MTPEEEYAFYGAIGSFVLSILFFIGYFFTPADSVLSRGTMALFIIAFIGSLGASGYYYYLKQQDASTYVETPSCSSCGC